MSSEVTQNIPVLVDKKLLEPLGQMVVNFSFLEYSLSSYIGNLLFRNDSKEKNKGIIITAELSFKQKVNLFCSLFKHIHNQDNNEFEKLRKELFDVEEERNKKIHSLITGVSDGTEVQDMRIKISAKAKKGLSIDSEAIKSTEVKEFADKLGHITYKLGKLCRNEIASSLRSSQ